MFLTLALPSEPPGEPSDQDSASPELLQGRPEPTVGILVKFPGGGDATD